MNGIGNLIFRLRKNKCLTRAALSEGICSEKTIYYIEKKERMPSVAIMNKIEERLGVDVCEYLRFLECKDPIKVKCMVDQLDNARNSYTLELLKELIEDAVLLEDFGLKEFEEELNFNRLFSEVIEAHDPNTTQLKIESKIKQFGLKLPIEDNTMVIHDLLQFRYINLLGVNSIRLGALERGLVIFQWLYKEISCLKNHTRYIHLYISVTLNYLHALRMNQNYELLLKISQELLYFLKLKHCNDRLYLVYWYNAQALFYLGDLGAASSELMKMIYCGAIELDTHRLNSFFESSLGKELGKKLLDHEFWVNEIRRMLSEEDVLSV